MLSQVDMDKATNLISDLRGKIKDLEAKSSSLDLDCDMQEGSVRTDTAHAIRD